MISQKEKKTFVEALNVVRCVKLIDRRWRSHAIVKPLVVKHALCPVKALSP